MASSTIPAGAMLKLAFPGLVDIPMLMPAEVAKLANTIVAYLLKQKETIQNFDEMVVLSFLDHEKHQFFLRLVQFFKSGAYTPFTKNAPPLLIVRRNDAQERYDPKVHEGIPCPSTDGTFALFIEDIKVLVFSIEIGQRDLQEYSTQDIMSRYPIHTREMLYFIDTLTHRKLNLAAIGVELAIAMKAKIEFLKAELLADQTLAEILRMFARPKDEMIAILDVMDDRTIERLIQHCNPGLTATRPNVAGMLDAFVRTQLTPKDELSQVPISGRQIMIAGHSGYGTLRKSAQGTMFNYRNKDFLFEKGEVLLLTLDTRSTVNGFKNFVVEIGVIPLQASSRTDRSTIYIQGEIAEAEIT
ncbi:hypothetical protein LTR95_011054 [Oleoguttula sp. CCFEE 5521]